MRVVICTTITTKRDVSFTSAIVGVSMIDDEFLEEKFKKEIKSYCETRVPSFIDVNVTGLKILTTYSCKFCNDFIFSNAELSHHKRKHSKIEE